MKSFESLGLRSDGKRLFVLDQTLLPNEEVWLESKQLTDMIEMIKSLRIRGAPLIGVAAATELARLWESGVQGSEWKKSAALLRESRPTAVNLMHAVDRMVDAQDKIKVAYEIFSEDVQMCDRMAEHGQGLIKDGDSIITHCNTGGLATAGVGTALGVIRRAWDKGKKIHVYVDETRPLLQGSRLTVWELNKLGIPHTLICDSMAADLMRQGKIQAAFVGADRIAANFDFANKVGTYGLAVQAKFHRIPFYTVAPETTRDLSCPNGAAIPVEQRSKSEILDSRLGLAKACKSLLTQVYNPSFDVTPATLLSGVVLDSGFVRLN